MPAVLTARNLGIAALAAAGGAAYAVAEAKSYRLTRHEVPLGAGALRILHLSDTHLMGSNRRLISFLEELPSAMGGSPDLVLATGDLIEDDSGIDPLLDALHGLAPRYGKFFVLGSHDYYESSLRAIGGAARALFRLERDKVLAVKNSTGRLVSGLEDDGWTSLLNRTETITAGDLQIRLSGTDDPYLNRHRTDHIARNDDDDLAIALVHAPDVVSEWMLNGFDLVLAGHTHAGQVRAPFVGALMSNCTLPLELAGGLHQIGGGWLHVSPGLGTGRFTPIRFLARPEATLLELV